MFLKSWPNGPASSRKWTQVELAKRLASFFASSRKSQNKDILRHTILYFIG